MRLASVSNLLLCAAFSLLLFSSCVAQETGPLTRSAKVCEILQNPASFDGQIVRFRASLDLEFEGDVIEDQDCGLPPPHTEIWWTYGGEPLPVLPRDRKQAESLVSPAQRDAAFDSFERYVHLRRAFRPDNSSCSHAECAYYDVIATFTGRFFAGKPLTWRKGLGGYGHMGCCHLFVIEQISDVTAHRTAVPSDDEPFACKQVVWDSEYPNRSESGWEARGEENKRFLLEQARSRGDDLSAKEMEPDCPLRFLGLTGRLSWSSRDLLLTYSAELPQQPSAVKRKKGKKDMIKSEGPVLVKVTRQSCQRIIN